MWNKIKAFFEFASKNGLYLPMAYDATTKKPSVTLLAFYLGVLVSFCSVVAMHFFPKLWDATIAALTFFVLTFIFYRMRRLANVKMDLDDKSLEFSDGSEKPKSGE